MASSSLSRLMPNPAWMIVYSPSAASGRAPGQPYPSRHHPHERRVFYLSGGVCDLYRANIATIRNSRYSHARAGGARWQCLALHATQCHHAGSDARTGHVQPLVVLCAARFLPPGFAAIRLRPALLQSSPRLALRLRRALQGREST